MNRYFLALCAIFTVAGCAACDPKPIDPCDPNPCGRGTCSAQGEKAVCSCETNFYPDSSGSCSLHFDPSSLAQKVFCPADSGRLEITGIQGQFAALNGYWVEIQPNTFDRCVWVLLNPALGVNLPDPGRPGQLIPQAKGLEVTAVDRDNPVLANGDPNEVQPLKEVKLLFKGHRGSVLLYQDAARTFEDVPFSVVLEGSLGNTTHFSPFYLLNTVPAASAKATRKAGKTVEVDFTGTLDEGSPLSWGMTHEIWETGTLLDTRATTQVWDIDLPGGNHALVLKAKDPYGMEDSKTVNVFVDLCTGNACLVWQTCREVDGACVGTDPCSPNPCQHGGTCSPTGVGTTTCSCNGNWSGSDCNICPAGFYIDGNGACVTDRCFNVTCGDGNLCNGTETCDSAVGCVAGTPVTCASDNNVCNGTEQCNTATGTCASVNPPTCNDGLACNGSETCNPSVGCVSGTAQTCSSHGACQEPTASCSCAAGFDPATDCSACLAGFGGANCDPVPTISGLAIDCSSTGGCAAGGFTYPVTFSYANATSCTAQAVKVSGIGLVGPLSPVTIDGGIGNLTYTSGSGGGDVIRITVSCQGPGGSTDSNPPLEFMQN